MVQLSSDAAAKYPFFEDYVRNTFVKVTSKPRVMKAFWKWSAFDEKPITAVFFKYGWKPIIGIRSLKCEYEGDRPSDPEWDPKTRDMTALKGYDLGRTWDKEGINVNDSLMAMVEDVIVRAGKGKKEDFDSHILEVIEATILHEMIHWSYYFENINEWKKYGGDEEYGTSRFEQEAYGDVVGLFPGKPDPFCFIQAVNRLYLGLTLTTGLGKSWENTCKIVSVKPGSPADKAGLQPDDVIVTFDGQKISSPEDYRAQVEKN